MRPVAGVQLNPNEQMDIRKELSDIRKELSDLKTRLLSVEQSIETRAVNTNRTNAMAKTNLKENQLVNYDDVSRSPLPSPMPRARLATPRARVVAQAPGWKNNPAVVGVKQLYGRVVDGSLAKENVKKTTVKYETEFKNDPDSTETAVAAFNLQAALNAYYKDTLQLPPAFAVAGTIVAGALATNLGDIF